MSTDAPAALLTVDGLTPRSIAEPASVDEVAAALREANEHGAAVIPWGAGRHMSLGNIPTRYDIALRTSKLDRVLEYEPADLTITVEAGITMGRLQSTLAERGQFLPIDAPADATVGGVLSAGVSGASRHAYGLPRDWLIGCRLALADGTIVKAGGRVVKNVAGYDMQKLAVGSLGTLAVIVEATFKVAPLPVAQETLLATFDSVDAAAQAVRAADERSLALRAVALRQAQGNATTAFWLSGPTAAVERTRDELSEICAGAKKERLDGDASQLWWTDVGAGLDPPSAPAGDDVAVRISMRPSQIADSIAAAQRNDPPFFADALAFPTTGLLVARVHAAAVDRIADARRFVEAAGGSLVILAAPVSIKQRIDVWGDVGSALALMRNLKQQFDPRSTLNPGRYIGVM
jgi:glycolate oxidase FAD binding subunit